MSQSADTLTDPISLELFEDPVQTPCCGNTLSRISLRKALPRCPLCRIHIADEHPAFKVDNVPINRTVAHLVEAHRAQQILDKVMDPAAEAATRKRGDRVLIHSLKGRADLNGNTGSVLSFEEGKGRYAVRVGRESVLLKPSNLEAAAKDLGAPPSSSKRAHQLSTRAQRVREGGGLAVARDPDASIAKVLETRGGGALLAAVLDGLSNHRLHAFSDPDFDRLLLASRRSSEDAAGAGTGIYQEHLVEACLEATPAVAGGATPADATSPPVDLTDGGAGGEMALSYSCRWVMMDYTIDDLQMQGLSPVDPPTVRDYFAPALAIFEACQQQPPAPKGGGVLPVYSISADPNVSSPPGDDTAFLVEQMLGDSSLRFLLSPAAIARITAKRPIDPNDVQKALAAFGGVSLRKQ